MSSLGLFAVSTCGKQFEHVVELIRFEPATVKTIPRDGQVHNLYVIGSPSHLKYAIMTNNAHQINLFHVPG